jgi:hypothetical protein
MMNVKGTFEDVITNRIYKSDNYKLLSFSKCNRIGSQEQYSQFSNRKMGRRFKKRVEQLKISIKKNGYDEQHPIIVWKDPVSQILFILDGQGRYAACEELGVPYLYTIHNSIKSEKDAEDYINLHNNIRLNWSVEDRVYVSSKSHDVLTSSAHSKIIELDKRLNCGATSAMTILYGINSIHPEKFGQNIRERRNWEITEEILSKCRNMGVKFWSNLPFVRAVAKMCETEGFNDKVKKKFLKQIITKTPLLNTTDYLRMFEVMLSGNGKIIELTSTKIDKNIIKFD